MLHIRTRLTPWSCCDVCRSLPSQVSAHVGDAELESCLKGAELVVIPAGVPRKPGMTRDDLFNINAGIVLNLVGAVAKHCPNVRGMLDPEHGFLKL